MNPSTCGENTEMANDEIRYSAVWRPSTEGEIQVYGWTYADYRKKYDELWKQGWRLKALQPFVLSGDQVRYTAVWRPSTEGEIQIYDAPYETYRAKYDELWKQGWRLKLIQPYVVAGQVRYTAVWQPSKEGEMQVYGWTYADFRKKYDELWKQGWRLKALQPFVLPGDQVRYTAVWRPSTEGEIQIYDVNYEAYRAKYDELWKQGWRLKLLQPYVVGGRTRYTAVWRPATTGEFQLYGATYEQYRKRYDELWNQGWRLQSLTPLVDRSDIVVRKALEAYDRTGGVTSPLGLPTGAVSVAAGQGRWRMTGGHITTTAAGNPEIIIDQHLRIWFVGFKCWGESTELSGSDEPYFIVSWGGLGRSATSMFKFTDVDKGDVRVTPAVVADNQPVVTSVLHVAVMENDEGSPSDARKKVDAAMQKAAAAAAQGAAIYDLASAAAPGSGLTPAATIAGMVTGGPIGALIAGGLVEGLGLADDYVGEHGETLFARGYAPPQVQGTVPGTNEPYTHKFWIDGKGEGKYDVFLRAEIVNQPRPWVA
jgi:phage terminase small subunit